MIHLSYPLGSPDDKDKDTWREGDVFAKPRDKTKDLVCVVTLISRLDMSSALLPSCGWSFAQVNFTTRGEFDGGWGCFFL